MSTFWNWLQDELHNDAELSNICDYVMADVQRRVKMYGTNQNYYTNETNPVYLMTAFSLFEQNKAIEVLYKLVAQLDISLATEEMRPHILKAIDSQATVQELQAAYDVICGVIAPDPNKGDLIPHGTRRQGLFLYQLAKQIANCRINGWIRGESILCCMNLLVAQAVTRGESSSDADIDDVRPSILTTIRTEIPIEEFLYVNRDPQTPRFDDVVE